MTTAMMCVTMDADVAEAIEAIAVAEGIPRSQVVRRAAELYIAASRILPGRPVVQLVHRPLESFVEEQDAEDCPPSEDVPPSEEEKEAPRRMRGCSSAILGALKDGAWTRTDVVVGRVRERSGLDFSRAQVLDSLRYLAGEGRIERYPPVVKGRYPQNVEWRRTE